MKNVIIPIDFSEDSLHALDLAVLFSEIFHVNVQMVYVLKKSGDYLPHSIDEEKFWAEEKFKKIIDNYSPKLKNESRLRFIIKEGKIYKEVVNQAESYKECLIMASTHGASGFEELFIGSNAYKIISATKLPVITIRKGNVPRKITKIVMPLDMVQETRQKVPVTTEIAKLFEAEVHVVTVTTSKDEGIKSKLESYQKQVSEYIQNQDVPVKNDALQGKNITDITLEYAAKVDADFISIMTEQETDFKNLFIGDYALQMITKSDVPVLSITPQTFSKPGDSFFTFGATGLSKQF